VLAYVLGIRPAFDADHIAAIDDTTRRMVARGWRPIKVGFFFAMGHSSVVVALALVIAGAAAGITSRGLDEWRAVGGVVSTIVAMSFLALVAVLNAMVLKGIIGLWREMRRGQLDDKQLDSSCSTAG
jgi:nickel/cobalt transporter (NiCoT) family protein